MKSVCLYFCFFVTAHTITHEAVGSVGSRDEERLASELAMTGRGL